MRKTITGSSHPSNFHAAVAIFDQEIPMLSIFRRVMKSENGATAIEYTLIASLIAVAAIVAMGNVGTKVNGVLSNVASTMK
jgi:pilus assembly protein Flp/PilA